MEQQSSEWDYFFHPLPEDGDEDPPTRHEIWTLRDFVEHFGQTDEIPADAAARRLMSLCDEDQQVAERGDFANKGDRVSWFLWDIGMFMPRYQRAVLKVVEAVRALSVLERTDDQIRSGRFADSLLQWNRLDKFEEIWNDRSIYFSNVNRYGSFPFEGLDGYVFTNTFHANHLSIYPPSSPRSPELCSGFYTIVFALEQDPWNHTPRLPILVTDFIIDGHSWSCSVYRNFGLCFIPIFGPKRSLIAGSSQITKFKYVERGLFFLDAEVAVLERKAALDKQAG